MSELELREKVMNLSDEMSALLNNGETEKRELTEVENNRLAEIRSEIDNLNAEITKIQEENRNLNNNKSLVNKRENTMKDVKLINLINGIVEGRSLNENEAAYVTGNKISTRAAIQATVEGQGQENVPEDKMGLDVAIRNASVLNKLGCTWFSNAVGDVSIPRYHGSNVAWKGESVAAEDGASAFTETILTPKRLTAYIDISKQFLAQDSNDAEAILINDLAAAIAEKLDMTVFGDAASADTKPAGIFYNAETTALADVDYETVLALEEKVEEKNGVNFMFVTNPKVKYQLKGTQMASGLEMVFAHNEIDGYKAVVSNSVAGVACLDPRDLAVATWGGLEITIDDKTRAIYNEVRVVVNFLVDAKLRGDRIAVLGLSE